MGRCWNREWEIVPVDVMLSAKRTVVAWTRRVKKESRQRFVHIKRRIEHCISGSALHIRSGFGRHDPGYFPHEYPRRLP